MKKANSKIYDLTNCNILFTGKLLSFKRDKAIELAQIFGAHPQRSFSKNINFVIAGVVYKTIGSELTTKKLKLAAKHKVLVITEKDFLNWITYKVRILQNTLK